MSLMQYLYPTFAGKSLRAYNHPSVFTKRPEILAAMDVHKQGV